MSMLPHSNPQPTKVVALLVLLKCEQDAAMILRHVEDDSFLFHMNEQAPRVYGHFLLALSYMYPPQELLALDLLSLNARKSGNDAALLSFISRGLLIGIYQDITR